MPATATGLRFGKHYDSSDTDALGRETMYTVLLYLTACGGGETVFYSEHGGEESARVAPEPGLVLLHRRGWPIYRCCHKLHALSVWQLLFQ